MNFWDKLWTGDLWTRKPKENKRDLYSTSDPAIVQYFGSTTYTGEIVNECTALNIAAVYRCVSLISGSIKTLPLRAVETDDQGRKYRKASWLDNPYGPPDDPSVYQGTQEQWTQTVAAHYTLYNEVFLWLVRNGAGVIVGALPIHPNFVTVKCDENAPGQRLYCITQDDGSQVEVGTDQIHHIIGFTTDGVRGVHVLRQARQALGIAISGEKSAGKVMTNGPQHVNLITPSEDFTEDEATTIQASVQSAIGGADNAGKSVMINRALTVSPLTMSYADAQFLETRVFQIEEIARWFGIPPHLLGLTEKQTSWGSGVAEQNLGLARYVLNPITSGIAASLSRLLGKKVQADFDFKGFLKPSPEVEINLIIQQVTNGLLTPNEGRALLDRPPIEGGDTLRLPPGSLPPTEGANMNVPQDSQTTNGNQG
jgi:HK97 family phage portal protein